MQQIEHLLRQWSSKSSKSGKSGKRRRMPRLKKRTSVVLGAMRRCDGMGIPSDAHAFGRFRPPKIGKQSYNSMQQLLDALILCPFGFDAWSAPMCRPGDTVG